MAVLQNLTPILTPVLRDETGLPERFVSHFYKGVEFYTIGEMEEALNEFNIAASLEPFVHEVYNNLGVTLWELERYDEASKAYSRAISIVPEFAEARFNLGLEFLYQDDYEEALNEFDRASATRPQDEIISAGRTIALKKLLRGLVKGAPEAWSGRQPAGAKQPLVLKPNSETVSQAIIEDRG